MVWHITGGLRGTFCAEWTMMGNLMETVVAGAVWFGDPDRVGLSLDNLMENEIVVGAFLFVFSIHTGAALRFVLAVGIIFLIGGCLFTWATWHLWWAVLIYVLHSFVWMYCWYATGRETRFGRFMDRLQVLLRGSGDDQGIEIDDDDDDD